MTLNTWGILATLLNICVPSFNSNQLATLKYTFEKKRNAFALEYCKAHQNTYILMVFPMANIEDDATIQEIANTYGNIIHTKKLYLSTENAMNFLKLIYLGHGKHLGRWLGTPENNFKGARIAVKQRFSPKDMPLRIYVYESESLFAVQKCKSALRKYIGQGREPVHANDTHEETMKIA